MSKLFNKKTSITKKSIGSPQHFDWNEHVSVDANGIPLDIPDELIEELVVQVLKEVRSDGKGKFETDHPRDKVAAAVLQRVRELENLGREKLMGMSEDGIAAAVLQHMKLARMSTTFALKVEKPSEQHRLTMEVIDDDIPVYSTITVQDIAALKNINDKVALFKEAITPFLRNFKSCGTFHRVSKLGQGASGTVYHCTMRNSRDTVDHVALKQMKLKSQAKLELLLEELRILHTMKHENIVNLKMAYLQEDQKEDSLCVVMDYLDGNSLYVFLCNKEQYYMTEPEIAYLAQCTLSALNFLHTKGMIHRDIKSDNILVGKDGRCKLTDFGFCARFEPQSLRHTKIGTPAWMAPEMFEGAGYDHRIDTWSFGITLIECLDLEPPFLHLPRMEMHMNIKSLKGLPPIKNWDKASPDLQCFLREQLVVNKLHRQGAGELLSHGFLQLACDQSRFGAMVMAYSNDEFE